MSPFSDSGGAGGSGIVDVSQATPVAPILANLTKLNINNTNQTVAQVGSTVVLTSGGAGNNDLSIVAQAAPSAHFQFTTAVRFASGGAASAIGVCFREISSGKIAFVYVIPSNGAGGFNWGVNLNTNPTTFDRGVRGASGIFPASPYWFRLRYDGTSMRVLISSTGLEGQFSTHDVWSPVADLGWTAPTGAGVAVASNSSPNQATAQISSWFMEALA